MNVSNMAGKTFKKVYKNENGAGDENGDEIIFENENGDCYVMYHDRFCCEKVYIEDICGDLHDLEETEILVAEEAINRENPKNPEHDYSYTWTFYKFATIKGYVTIRWYGTSNGCYSEMVDLKYVKNNKLLD